MLDRERNFVRRWKLSCFTMNLNFFNISCYGVKSCYSVFSSNFMSCYTVNLFMLDNEKTFMSKHHEENPPKKKKKKKNKNNNFVTLRTATCVSRSKSWLNLVISDFLKENAIFSLERIWFKRGFLGMNYSFKSKDGCNVYLHFTELWKYSSDPNKRYGRINVTLNKILSFK